MFDGFLLSVWEGHAPRPEEGAIASGVRTVIRSDLTTPVIVVNSEFEAHHLAGLPVTDTEHLPDLGGRGDAARRRRATAPRSPAPEGGGQSLEHRPRPRGRAPRAARLARPRTRAPSQPRIAVDAGRRPTLRRDDLGNVVGGIRLPELEAPTHEYHGSAFGTGRAPPFGFGPSTRRRRGASAVPTRRRVHGAMARRRRRARRHRCPASQRTAPTMKARADEVSLPMPCERPPGTEEYSLNT